MCLGGLPSLQCVFKMAPVVHSLSRGGLRAEAGNLAGNQSTNHSHHGEPGPAGLVNFCFRKKATLPRKQCVCEASPRQCVTQQRKNSCMGHWTDWTPSAIPPFLRLLRSGLCFPLIHDWAGRCGRWASVQQKRASTAQSCVRLPSCLALVMQPIRSVSGCVSRSLWQVLNGWLFATCLWRFLLDSPAAS
jgi:hypothetical protein